MGKFILKKDFIEALQEREATRRNKVAMLQEPQVWLTTSGKEITSDYPLEEESYFSHLVVPDIKMVSSPYKTIDEDEIQKVGVQEIKNI